MSYKLQKLNVIKIAETDEQKEKYISDGFKLIEGENAPGAGGVPNYSEMTVQDLQAICKENGLNGYSSLSKDDLVKFIQENLKK
ncbi:SAP domain-containing protein [Clostridium saccharoperbutylacetonicum]|uniref:SAP domain-containing protein n=1 Tax=Clostridium saccharoperbutylacetonicum TaxID=36745 RepID=UPI0039EAAF16